MEQPNLNLETRLLEGVLRKIRNNTSIKSLQFEKEEYRLDLLICLEIAIKHCIENIDYIKSELKFRPIGSDNSGLKKSAKFDRLGTLH